MHDTTEPHKMNRTLAIEPLNGTFSPTEAPPRRVATPTRFAAGAGPARDTLPVRRFTWKLEELFEVLIEILSVVYLIGAIGFGGLLLYYSLGR
jgi:hypothetical protein